MPSPKQIERAERAISTLMRLGISLILPLWGLIMLILGVIHRSPSWIATGLAVVAIGLLLAVGSPLLDSVLRNR